MIDYFDPSAVVERINNSQIKLTLRTGLNDDFRIVAIISANNEIAIETAMGGDGNEMDSPDLYELLSSIV